jgi:hypothetical protein
MKTIPCPCCDRPLEAPDAPDVIQQYGLSEFQARILETVWKGKGRPVSTEQIFSAMYRDDPDGGPLPNKMYAAFKEALFRIRGKLAGTGIEIVAAGYRAGYKLRIEP